MYVGVGSEVVSACSIVTTSSPPNLLQLSFVGGSFCTLSAKRACRRQKKPTHYVHA